VHPANGHVHLLSPVGQELYEIDQKGSLISTYDLSHVVLTNPAAMTFAPTGDTTDDPERVSLYVAESGPAAAKLVKASSPGSGEITELLLESPISVQATFTTGLVQTILTSQWNPPSPDPSGITYYPPGAGLMISDGEVNEMTIYQGANVFRSDFFGNLGGTFTTLTRIDSNEPTGVAYKASNNRLFFSDDSNPRIYEVATGPDNVHGTSDDVVTSFATGPFGSNDPEGITYNPTENALYIADGVNDEIYKVLPGPDGLFNGSGDIVTSFDTASFGITDPEGVEYNPDTNTLFIVGHPKESMAETTLSGSLLRMIDISAAAAFKPAGVAYA
jgi:DNA-binding beta-propeller fold protein YncE